MIRRKLPNHPEEIIVLKHQKVLELTINVFFCQNFSESQVKILPKLSKICRNSKIRKFEKLPISQNFQKLASGTKKGQFSSIFRVLLENFGNFMLQNNVSEHILGNLVQNFAEIFKNFLETQ